MALAANGLFVALHIWQTRVFYDGLAQDTSVMASQFSVIFMLVFVLIMDVHVYKQQIKAERLHVPIEQIWSVASFGLSSGSVSLLLCPPVQRPAYPDMVRWCF